MDVPSALQIPFVVVVGLIGFLLVLLLSSFSVQELQTEDPLDTAGVTDGSPVKSVAPSTPTKMKSPLGTMQTPAGRRSARIDRKTRKEE
mmetsp:Transcript_18077/g.23332  ORF Transcript_18077/g.23332 Transcript_18077/m.23332 type:complete len:89 (-) Transcript_18077:336-602(-)|eukprot:CAMPEP_0198154460 /NCGR_PEP_ID=MMETSP1443-20131203/68603_1 /TAXON_ID=186043 /ORGANISM="Entomoneis sp., Strain CCMP2396" /LENGTH=88 /DNA_ID=CAMNT_0043821131 /DNA_START=154 /DNA_END=420 /DNA_ORIENTATION=+